MSCGMKPLAMLFGLPIAALGAALTILPLIGGVSNADGTSSPWWDYAIIFTMGTPPLLIGLWMIFGRRGATIDRAGGQLETWYSVVIPVRRKSIRIPKNLIISLGLHTVSRGHGVSQRTSQVYAVKLIGGGGLILNTFTNATAAREFAERCARTFGLPMENRLEVNGRQRQPVELDLPFVKRLHQPEYLEEFPITAKSRLQIVSNTADRQVRVNRPLMVSGWKGYLSLIGLAAIPLYYVGPIILDPTAPWFFRLPSFMIPVSLFALVYGSNLVHTEVFVMAKGLSVTKSIGFVRFSNGIPLEKIEELYFDGNAIAVVSDQKRISLAVAHTDSDSLALESLLRKWLREVFEETPVIDGALSDNNY